MARSANRRYPYSKTLRQYRPCTTPRYLSTHHERDKATGYDNRGARLYDSEIGRFLGVDPLAGKFAGWSPYNYVLDNPVLLADPDGREPIDPTNHRRWYFYRTFGHSAYEAVKSIGVVNGYKGLYLVAQRRVENGFNPAPGNNPFNIKGTGDMGSITYTTTEVEDGVRIKKKQTFASFSTSQKGLEAQLELLKKNFPVAFIALTLGPATIEDYASGLQDYGRLGVFATNPNYKTELAAMFNGIKRDYNQWFDHNIEIYNRQSNSFRKLVQSGMITKDQHDDYLRTHHRLADEAARLEREKEKLNEVN